MKFMFLLYLPGFPKFATEGCANSGAEERHEKIHQALTSLGVSNQVIYPRKSRVPLTGLWFLIIYYVDIWKCYLLNPNLIFVIRPGIRNVLIAIMFRKKYVVELHGVLFVENDKVHRIASMMKNRLQCLIISNSKGVICATSEIANYYDFNLPVHIMPNGIALNRLENKEYNSLNFPSNGEPFSLLFLHSNSFPWQGFEHVLSLARNIPEYRFICMGHGTLSIAAPNIEFKPYSEIDFDYISRHRIICGLAFSAIQVKGLSQACSLKARSYVELNLPLLIDHMDVDFSQDNLSFALQVGSRNSPMEIEKIRAFLEMCKQGASNPSNFDLEHLTWQVRIKAMLFWIDSL